MYIFAGGQKLRAHLLQWPPVWLQPCLPFSSQPLERDQWIWFRHPSPVVQSRLSPRGSHIQDVWHLHHFPIIHKNIWGQSNLFFFTVFMSCLSWRNNILHMHVEMIFAMITCIMMHTQFFISLNHNQMKKIKLSLNVAFYNNNQCHFSFLKWYVYMYWYVSTLTKIATWWLINPYSLYMSLPYFKNIYIYKCVECTSTVNLYLLLRVTATCKWTYNYVNKFLPLQPG